MSGGATLDVAYESGCPSGGANLLGDPSEDVGGPGYRVSGGEEGKEGRLSSYSASRSGWVHAPRR